MASWQNDPNALQGETDIVYLVAMNENCNAQPPTAPDLDQWQAELGFEATMLTDPLRNVYTAYADANNCANSGPGGPGCSNAVTVIIDKTMRIRHFGRTYLCGTGSGNGCGQPGNIDNASCLDEELTLLQQLLQE